MKIILAACLCAAIFAQSPYSTSIEPSVVLNDIPAYRGSAALWQSLKKLHTRASLLMITAHPDDEDGGMLTYESRGEGARVALLTLNRGEGGANVMSADYFDALGLVRTMELLKADQYYGVDQYFTRVIDYGFSKTKVESISKWTHDRVFYDVVRVVRMTRPLVITSVFVGGPSDGHGNHQTAGALTREVFEAAGDPTVFPDQIQAGLKPWRPLKDYARVPYGLRANLPLNVQTVNVQIPTGQYDPLLGVSYLQLAREGLGYQKSQNGGTVIPLAGPAFSGYQRFASQVGAPEKEDSLFAGIDISLKGIATLADAGANSLFLSKGLSQINQSIEDAMAKFSAIAPERSAPALATGLKQTGELLDRVEKSTLSAESKFNIRHELQIKSAQFNNALIEALGISLAAEGPQAATPGETFNVRLHLVNQSPEAVAVVHVRVIFSDVDFRPTKLPFGGNASVRVSKTIPLTRPYFSRPDIEQTYYDILDPRLLNQSLSPYPFAAWADLSYRSVSVRIGQYVQSAKDMTVVAPALSVSLSPRAGVVPLSAKSFSVAATVHSNIDGEAKGKLRLELPRGWASEPNVADFSLPSAGSEQTLAFQVTPSNLGTQVYPIRAIAQYAGQTFTEGYQTTGYPGLRPYFLYRPAVSKLSGVDLKVAEGLRIAYIMGSGDEVPAALEHLGTHVTFLSSTDLESGDLSRFDLILLGVRTYAARGDLRTHNARLLDYVRNGGIVIVQYNTPEFDHNFGPYPYHMSDDPEEVTDEASTVHILEPTNPIFNWPNQVTVKDFDGWVEERGSKWLKSWDSHYSALLETHDEDQPEQRGGLLYAKYGKGIYIYNAYAFYRQLPEGVPGAYRLFANMISLPRNPQR